MRRVIKYIKAIKKIHEKTSLINPDILQRICIDIFEQILNNNSQFDARKNDFNKCVNYDKIDCNICNKALSHYDRVYYIEIVNELSDFLPKEETYRSRIIELFMNDKKNSDFERTFYEDSLLTIEYFKLLINFDIEPEHQLRYIEGGLSEYLHQVRRDSKVFLEILKTINRMNRASRHNHLKKLLNEIVQFMCENKEYIRESPEIALESINLLLTNNQTKTAFDIFPEFGQIPKREEELLHLQTFLNIFRK
ncbi:hypothetical protein EZS27_008174 [termite gut metagenome]|uniref:Uncharacterized protein n=1 Tax=termite gut metagenome TaxID=433724 RepID=A0A5J4SFZ8_9ZZZZ